jgi:hypothetical protein
MGNRETRAQPRTIGWDNIDTSAALFSRNNHLKRGVCLNNIHKFSFCRTVKTAAQLKRKIGLILFMKIIAVFLRESYEIRTHSVGKIQNF